jgi:hypothetical protein
MLEATQVNKYTEVKHKFNVATAAQLREQVLRMSAWLTAQQVSDNAGYKGETLQHCQINGKRRGGFSQSLLKEKIFSLPMAWELMVSLYPK